MMAVFTLIFLFFSIVSEWNSSCVGILFIPYIVLVLQRDFILLRDFGYYYETLRLR
jgi:hypothetical protein